MYKDRSAIGIIPARGGSKGLPGKNIMMLCGKPLIAWSIEAGLRSKYLDHVMVTTDSEEIADVSKKYGATVPFLRPQELARDYSTTFDAVQHTVEHYRNMLGNTFDYIILLEPTSPLREKDDIDNMIKELVENENHYDSIVSIGEVHEHPSIMKKVIGNSLVPFCEELKLTTRRQDNQPAYFPYGVAYIVKTSVLLKEKTFYTSRTTFYKINRYQNYEIDDIYDFLAIENIMKYQWRLL
ncbi:MAG TPA: acylneuraminate cytidylyltransferase family protein [Nitrospirota bacterium]|nr:acylneuraminate cytidylyltransferase family protein [Nitrospirota bacterium]